ncbi:GIY-YIG nuclease family protein [Gordonia sp. ABSL49_1]|uniref:GIY-YIG nuclease family protein n=1 Tax=Gordonia sp. ABSL49_1 TaxID=2920941 RepID=UPI0035ADDA2F
MIGYLYILECADGTLYVGSTRNIELRFEQHQSGRGSRYTSSRLPVRLVYLLECPSVAEAYALEKRPELVAGQASRIDRRTVRPVTGTVSTAG